MRAASRADESFPATLQIPHSMRISPVRHLHMAATDRSYKGSSTTVNRSCSPVEKSLVSAAPPVPPSVGGLWLAGGCASGSTPSTHTPRVAPAGPEGHPNATAPRRRAPRTTFRRAEPIIARRRDRAMLAQQLAIMSRARQDGRRIDALMTSAPPFRRETGPHRPPSRRSPGALLRLDACPENRGLLPWGVMLRPRVLKSAASPCHSRAISHWGRWPPRPHHRAAPPRPRCRQRARWT